MMSIRTCDFQGLKESNLASCGGDFREPLFENWKVLNVADVNKNEQKTITVPNFLYNFLFSVSTSKVQGICKLSEYIVVLDKEIFFGYSLDPFKILVKLPFGDHLISNTGKAENSNNGNKDENVFSSKGSEESQTSIYEEFTEETKELLNRYCVNANYINRLPFFLSPEKCRVFFPNEKKTSNEETSFRGVHLFNEQANTYGKSLVDNCFDSYIDAKCADYDSGFFYVYSLKSYLCYFVDKGSKKMIIIFLPVSACGFSKARELGTYIYSCEDYIKQLFAQISGHPITHQNQEFVIRRNLEKDAFDKYDKEGEKAPTECIRLRKCEFLNVPKNATSKIPARRFSKSMKRYNTKNISKNRDKKKTTSAFHLLKKEDAFKYEVNKYSNVRSKSMYATDDLKIGDVSEDLQILCFCMDQDCIIEYGKERGRKFEKERERAKESESEIEKQDAWVQKLCNYKHSVYEHSEREICDNIQEREQTDGSGKRDGHSTNNGSKQGNNTETNGNSKSDTNGEMNDTNGSGIGDSSSGSGNNNGGDDDDNSNSDRNSGGGTNDEDEDSEDEEENEKENEEENEKENEKENEEENEKENEKEKKEKEEKKESIGDDDNEKNRSKYDKEIMEDKSANAKRKRKEKARMEKNNKRKSIQKSKNKEPVQMNGNIENRTINSRNTEYECADLNNNSSSSISYNSDNLTNISANNQLTISNNNSIDVSVSSFSDLNGSAKSSSLDTKETQDGLERMDMGEVKKEAVSKGKKSGAMEKVEEEIEVKKMKTNENTEVATKVEGKNASKEQGSTVEEEDEDEYASRKETVDQSDTINGAEQDVNRTAAFSEMSKEENGYMLNEEKTNNDENVKKEESEEDANLRKKIGKKSSKKKIEKHGKCFEDEKKEVLTKVSQVTRVGGVCFDKNRQRWIAHWKIDGKYHKHYFPINQYGFENARERAVNCRKQAEKQYNLPEIQPRNRCNQMRINTSPYVKRALKLPRCDGVGFDEMSQSWVSTYVVHKKFAVDDYGFYEAREKAIFCRKTFEKVNSNVDYKQLLTETIGTDEEEQKALNVLLNIDISKIEEMLSERNVRTTGNKSNGENNSGNKSSGSHSKGGGMKRNQSGGSESVTSVEQNKQNKSVSVKGNDENSEMLSDRNEHLKVTQEAIEMILKNIKHKTLPEIKLKLEDKQKFENYDTLLDKHFKFITSAKTVGQLRPYISLFHSFIVCHTLPQNMPFKEQLFIVEALDCSSFFAEATK